jgi:transposase-like protein/transposase Tn5 family protein
MYAMPIVMSPAEWADRTFAAVDLGDRRRECRTVSLAARMMRHPDASLPQQMHAPPALKAAYRLLDEDDVTFAALSTPHWETTRERAGRQKLVLLVQDTTEIDYSHHPKTEGLGPIGNGRGQGYLLQTVLAVLPQPRQVLGIAAQEPFLRKRAPKGQSCSQRRTRERESQVWSRMVQAVGRAPEGSTWVHVGDRYSDIFDFMEACHDQQGHFLIRVAQDRRISADDGTVESLLASVRSLPAQDQRELKLRAQDGKPARTAQLSISFRAASLRPPAHSRRKPPLAVWIVRVWEAEPPDDVDEPLEWILLTSVPTLTVASAWERAAWYACRWVVEDYHQCLKTGCSLEQRHLQTYDGLVRLLGFLALIAVRLLQLRELARLEPERLASEAIPHDLARVVAHLAEVPLSELSLGTFWRTVARQGGHQGRKGDGPPGWKTLWQGWLEIQTLLEGIHLAARLPP